MGVPGLLQVQQAHAATTNDQRSTTNETP